MTTTVPTTTNPTCTHPHQQLPSQGSTGAGAGGGGIGIVGEPVIIKRSIFSTRSHQQVQDTLCKQVRDRDEYIRQLQALLREHDIEIPLPEIQALVPSQPPQQSVAPGLQLVDASAEKLMKLLESRKQYTRPWDITLEYTHLSYKVYVSPHRQIPSISSLLSNLVCFWKKCGPKKEIKILSDVTGRIKPRKMTLLIGPPGSGKSVLMKTLIGKLRPAPGARLEGDVFYQGDNIDSGNFIPAKIAGYVEQGDTLDAVLTVEETLKFAWLATTGGHHSYGRAKDAESAAILNQEDATFNHMKNVLAVLGLNGCKDTFVGNGMIRGVSGGQKRRVTIGEMVISRRPVMLMDCISNGLDSATTFDIVRAIRVINQMLGSTIFISLLQPPPNVYHLFDEIVLLSEGQVIYHGPRDDVVSYFASLGYQCPPLVDEADFLQELPTPEGKRFLTGSAFTGIHSTEALAKAWKQSELYQRLLLDMKCAEFSTRDFSGKRLEEGEYGGKGSEAVESGEGGRGEVSKWYPDQNEPFPEAFPFYFFLQLERQMKVVLRDAIFIKSRIGQSLLIGSIAGSLFSNIAVTDVSTMNGFLFNTILFGALGSFAILPIVYDQKLVFYKQSDALFYPTAAFTLAQSICLFPLQLIEQILYVTITYWSAGLSETEDGSRFITFILLSLMFSMTIGQMFRLISAIVPDRRGALPVAGIIIVVMVLFSGFIQPKAIISYGWIWFYWMNPMAWALKAVTINEYSSPKYDFPYCSQGVCLPNSRFGDLILTQYGNPTDTRYIWYSFAVLIGEYLLLFVLTFLCLKYLRVEPIPPPPVREEEETTTTSASSTNVAGAAVGSPASPAASQGQEGKEDDVTAHDTQLPFDQVSIAFQDIWYTVTLPNKEEIDLLKGVNGYFEPGTMTALMGSSGAGKTTLLDVLAGRKNTGAIRGEIYLNGVPKVDRYFRKIMAYVEQFDSLPQRSTAREAIAFSAALRLSSNISEADRNAWVESVLNMLDLIPLENELIGAMESGGMSFEQRKRVSIGVELASNPSILFLDEPTTGLDSRAAQSLIRNIRRIASSGRSIVCTIHQPSTAIFSAFDALLLLRRGGQTVFFGDLGDQCTNLVSYFENIPSVPKLVANVNPATWMLEVIGAGTGSSSSSSGNGDRATTSVEVDFHTVYKNSALCASNMERLAVFMQLNEGSQKILDEIRGDGGDLGDVEDGDVELGKKTKSTSTSSSSSSTSYNTSSWTQFVYLMHRIGLTYWRSPNYTVSRVIVNIFIALIFASAYPQQVYDTQVGTISRAAVIYVTTLFCGILALLQVIPVMIAERPTFYREQQSRMYQVWIYSLTTVIVEIPYVLVTSLAFTLPFFYIVGFDNIGNKTEKFFWYWFFQCAYQFTMMNIGQFYVALAPTESATQVFAGLTNTLFSLFCGFLITEQAFPTFWLFMYWLDPFHYVLEALITAMFHKDTTEIVLLNHMKTTAETFVKDYQYASWSYGHIGYDALALGLFITVAITGKYLALSFIRHDQR